MKKSKLKNGTPMFIVPTSHFVKLADFATALTQYYFKDKKEFDCNLKKYEAKKILKNRLFSYGLRGEYHDGFFEASEEIGDEYNNIYNDAKNWVIENYPYLNENN